MPVSVSVRLLKTAFVSLIKTQIHYYHTSVVSIGLLFAVYNFFYNVMGSNKLTQFSRLIQTRNSFRNKCDIHLCL
jgi:hypothetical protein